MKKLTIIMLLCVLVFQGCSSDGDKPESKAVTDNSEKVTEAVKETVTVTEAVKETAAVAEATVTPQPQLVVPILENKTGKVLIQTVTASGNYRTNSYIITSSNGERIVVDATKMPAKSLLDIEPAAILSTHTHPDHNDAKFVKEYPDAQTLFYDLGEIQTNDFHIYSVEAAHMGDKVNGTNYIMVIEVDGLRIAHMGDIGQSELTKDQLDALGEIDIAFMQFENSYSGIDVKNQKGFKLIEQLNPNIIIPTHYTKACLDLFKEKYIMKEFENILEISKEELPEDSLNLYLMSNTLKYQ